MNTSSTIKEVKPKTLKATIRAVDRGNARKLFRYAVECDTYFHGKKLIGYYNTRNDAKYAKDNYNDSFAERDCVAEWEQYTKHFDMRLNRLTAWQLNRIIETIPKHSDMCVTLKFSKREADFVKTAMQQYESSFVIWALKNAKNDTIDDITRDTIDRIKSLNARLEKEVESI